MQMHLQAELSITDRLDKLMNDLKCLFKFMDHDVATLNYKAEDAFGKSHTAT